MAYLTKHTYSKLCNELKINIEIDLDFYIDYIFDDPQIFFIFNKLFLKRLFIYRCLIEDEKTFIAEYYDYVPERFDTNRYVFERAGSLKYHLSDACPFLKKDFIGFKVPEDIQELGDEIVQEYRDWFKSKRYSEKYFEGTLDSKAVVFSYNSKFPPKYNVPVLNENYDIVKQIANSSFINIEESFNENVFKENLEKLKEEYYNYFSCPVLRLISKYDYLHNKEETEIRETFENIDSLSPNFIETYKMSNLKEKFKISNKITSKISQELLSYIRWKYNFKEKSFDEITLEKLGLECCGNCKEMQNFL